MLEKDFYISHAYNIERRKGQNEHNFDRNCSYCNLFNVKIQRNKA